MNYTTFSVQVQADPTWEYACRRCMNQENVVRGCDYFSEEHKCLSPIRGHYPRFKNWELFRRAVLMRALTRIAAIPVPPLLPLAQQSAITMRNIALEALECVNRINRIKRRKPRPNHENVRRARFEVSTPVSGEIGSQPKTERKNQK